jgi:hypothetical protein
MVLSATMSRLDLVNHSHRQPTDAVPTTYLPTLPTPPSTMQDPSYGIHRELLPHVHCLSTYRFPHFPSIHPEKVAEWLLAAPKITRDQSPFYWTYLDRPADGTVLLVWQTQNLGNRFPSDGYIWSPQETAFQLNVGAYVSFKIQAGCSC